MFNCGLQLQGHYNTQGVIFKVTGLKVAPLYLILRTFSVSCSVAMVILGRLFQVVGMLLCLEALYFGIFRESMGKEMMFLVLGGVVFLLGRFIEGRAG